MTEVGSVIALCSVLVCLAAGAAGQLTDSTPGNFAYRLSYSDRRPLHPTDKFRKLFGEYLEQNTDIRVWHVTGRAAVVKQGAAVQWVYPILGADRSKLELKYGHCYLGIVDDRGERIRLVTDPGGDDKYDFCVGHRPFRFVDLNADGFADLVVPTVYADGSMTEYVRLRAFLFSASTQTFCPSTTASEILRQLPENASTSEIRGLISVNKAAGFECDK